MLFSLVYYMHIILNNVAGPLNNHLAFVHIINHFKNFTKKNPLKGSGFSCTYTNPFAGLNKKGQVESTKTFFSSLNLTFSRGYLSN